jgi:hypothetical protein
MRLRGILYAVMLAGLSLYEITYSIEYRREYTCICNNQILVQSTIVWIITQLDSMM